MQYLALNQTVTANDFTTNLNFTSTALSGNLSASAMLAYNGLMGNAYIVFSNTSADFRGVQVGFMKENGQMKLAYRNGDTWTSLGLADANTFYKFDITISTSTYKYSLNITDLSGTVLYSISDASVRGGISSFDLISLKTYQADISGNGLYVDNISLSVVPEPKTAFLLGSGGLLVLWGTLRKAGGKTLVCLLGPILLLAQSSLPAQEKRIGPADASSSFGYYSTCPENPSGKLVCYVTYKSGIKVDNSRQEGELWICNTDLTNHRKVTDIIGFSPHDGADQVWIDDNHIVFRDYDKTLRTSALRVVDTDTGKDTQQPVIGATTLGHNTKGSRVLFNVEAKDGAIGKLASGIYEWNTETGAVIPVFLQAEYATKILAQLPQSVIGQKPLPFEQWQCLHSQYSPNHEKIMFRIDMKTPGELILSYDLQKKNIVVMQADPEHFLHTLWLDNDGIVSHDRGNNPWTKPGILKYWKIGASEGRTIGIEGNHLAVSPDGKAFASETAYWSNPTVLRYYPIGTLDITKATVVAQSTHPEMTWKKSFHMNPSFSRDGNRLYYNKAMDNQTSGTFCSNLESK
ncbi:MAG: hypothetical protein B9S32_15020 [Verrucomicrobia bacterium Tous-C9LFEB]|nr:MAG: hypothetical protein B9S32_15020 [Verrucomicrobia bacterium Tous-C9LFEB]